MRSSVGWVIHPPFLKGANMTEEVNILPKTLFRFRPENTKHFEEELRRTVHHDEVWCGPISAQNDPFDGNPSRIETSEEDMLKYAKLVRKKYGTETSLIGGDLTEISNRLGIVNEDAKEWMRTDEFAIKVALNLENSSSEFREWVKVVCFSTTLDSILMWSHYANSHQGVCLEYQIPYRTDASDEINKLTHVDYVKIRPSLTQLEWIKFLGYVNFFDDDLFSETEFIELRRRIILMKSKQWEYEKEWRWVDVNNAVNGYSILPLKVKSITVGERACAETIELCKEVSSAVQGVEVYKVKLSGTQFKFEREAI